MWRRHEVGEEVGLQDLLYPEPPVPGTIEEYAASDQIIHEPVPLAARPRYYFDVHHEFPALPQESIYQNVAIGLRLRMARNTKLHQQIIDEIIAATYDGQLTAGTVFSEPVGAAPFTLPPSSEELVPEEATGHLGGFPSKKLLRIAAICLATGVLIPTALFPAAAAAETGVKSFEQSWPPQGPR